MVLSDNTYSMGCLSVDGWQQKLSDTKLNISYSEVFNKSDAAIKVMTKKLSNFFMRDDCNKSDDKIWPNWLIGVMTIINRIIFRVFCNMLENVTTMIKKLLLNGIVWNSKCTNYRLALWSSKESKNSQIQALSYSKWLNFLIYTKKYQQEKHPWWPIFSFKI